MPASIIPGMVAEFIHRGQAVRFFVHITDSIQNHYIAGTFYEVPELEIIARRLKPGSVYLDVGSNVGNHAIYVSKFCQPGEVIVIEPNPPAIVLLRLNLLLNRLQLNTSFLGLGLSDQEGTASAITPPHNLGGTRLEASTTGELRLVTGDSLFAERPIDFIKMDVEGLELQALRGLERTIAASRPAMFIEVDDRNRAGFDAWVAEHDYVVTETFRRYSVNENFMILPREKHTEGAP